MSLRTYEAGALVGNGPSVSVGATVQLPEPVVPVVPVPVLDDSEGVTESSLLQAEISAGVERAPTNKLFRKFFLSMVFSSAAG